MERRATSFWEWKAAWAVDSSQLARFISKM